MLICVTNYHMRGLCFNTASRMFFYMIAIYIYLKLIQHFIMLIVLLSKSLVSLFVQTAPRNEISFRFLFNFVV